MHYCIHVFTEQIPSDDDLHELMTPFSDDAVYGEREEDDEAAEEQAKTINYPPFMWDYFVIGGRYQGRLKLKVDYEADDEYQWKFYAKEPREGRLFHSTLLKKIREKFGTFETKEENWLGYMGDLDGYIRVDGAKIKDLFETEGLSCYGFLDVDGKAYARSSWNGEDFIDDPDFDRKYEETLKNRSDCFLTVLDIHD